MLFLDELEEGAPASAPENIPPGAERPDLSNRGETQTLRPRTIK